MNLYRSENLQRVTMVIAVAVNVWAVKIPPHGWWDAISGSMIALMVATQVVIEHRRREHKRLREEMIARHPNPDWLRASIDYMARLPLAEHKQIIEWELTRPAEPLDEALLDAPPMVRDYYAELAKYER